MEHANDVYDVEAIVTVDGRGQLVLPKEVRAALSLTAGDKLAVVIKRSGGIPCCINLVPAPALRAGIRAVIEPAATGGTDR